MPQMNSLCGADGSWWSVYINNPRSEHGPICVLSWLTGDTRAILMYRMNEWKVVI